MGCMQNNTNLQKCHWTPDSVWQVTNMVQLQYKHIHLACKHYCCVIYLHLFVNKCNPVPCVRWIRMPFCFVLLHGGAERACFGTPEDNRQMSQDECHEGCQNVCAEGCDRELTREDTEHDSETKQLPITQHKSWWLSSYEPLSGFWNAESLAWLASFGEVLVFCIFTSTHAPLSQVSFRHAPVS